MTLAFPSPSKPMAMPSGIAGTVDGPGLTAEAIAWAKARGLSRATLERMNVASGTVFFPDAGKKLPALFFKYRRGWKARSIEGKFHVAGGGFKAEFWNLESVSAENRNLVYITEGELDACALVEAGIDPAQVLSVPTGAKERKTDELRGYDYAFDALRDGLSAAKGYVWCGDDDEPGHALRSDMARVFGAARFRFVTWPEGCKDANDLLRTDGPAELLDRVTNGSIEWPVDGLYALSELPEPPKLTLWEPGFPEWESKVRLARANLSVFTGHPNHGKTLLANQIWFQVARAYDDVNVCVASFETRAKPHLRRQLRTLITRELEKNMSEEQKRECDAWINERYRFISTDRLELTRFLDLAEVAVIRHGCKAVLLDPWNRMETARDARAESETDYIGRCLRTIHDFARDLNCHVMILAHPAKSQGDARGKPPTLESIASSKHWDNAPDQGFAIFRPDLYKDGQIQTEAIVYHLKTRFDELGHPCKLQMDFDRAQGRYVSTDYKVGY